VKRTKGAAPPEPAPEPAAVADVPGQEFLPFASGGAVATVQAPRMRKGKRVRIESLDDYAPAQTYQWPCIWCGVRGLRLVLISEVHVACRDCATAHGYDLSGVPA